MSRSRLVIDSEDNRGHPELTVPLGDLVDARSSVPGSEVVRGGVHEFGTERLMTGVVHFYVHVHIDCLEVVEIQ